MTDGPRWDLLEKIPDDMQIISHDNDHDAPLTIEVWRDGLGHPYAEGHGYCKTCGPAITCLLMAFYDAVMFSTVRELARMGGLVPRETSTEDTP